MFFTRAHVSLALLSLRKNAGVLVIYILENHFVIIAMIILSLSYCPAGSCYQSQLIFTFHFSGLIAGYTDYPATEKVLTVV